MKVLTTLESLRWSAILDSKNYDQRRIWSECLRENDEWDYGEFIDCSTQIERYNPTCDDLDSEYFRMLNTISDLSTSITKAKFGDLMEMDDPTIYFRWSEEGILGVDTQFRNNGSIVSPGCVFFHGNQLRGSGHTLWRYLAYMMRQNSELFRALPVADGLLYAYLCERIHLVVPSPKLLQSTFGVYFDPKQVPTSNFEGI